MATSVLQKYLDMHGKAVLLHEQRLSELGLTTVKTLVGSRQTPGGAGGISGLYDLAFERRDISFSAELVQFLKEIGFSPTEIQQLQQQAVYRSTGTP